MAPARRNLLAQHMLDVLGQIETLGLRLGDQVGFKIGRQLDRDGHMGVPPLKS